MSTQTTWRCGYNSALEKENIKGSSSKKVQEIQKEWNKWNAHDGAFLIPIATVVSEPVASPPMPLANNATLDWVSMLAHHPCKYEQQGGNGLILKSCPARHVV